MDNSASTFRERAGVVTAQIIVLVFVGWGLLAPFLAAWIGAPVTFDSDWKTNMGLLAAGAFAYLIGKQTTNPPAATASVPVTEQGSASVTVTTPAERPLSPPPKKD